MTQGNRSNALLVELMIVVMFFMVTTSVLLKVFAKARQLSDRSEHITYALAQAQNFADQLYAADDAEALLNDLGFRRTEASWQRTEENVLFEVIISEETDDAGTFRRQEVIASANGEQLFVLPCSRWEVKP